VFLSDLHLGTRGCQAEQVLSFLRRYDAEMIYLVGDIVDGWQLKTDWYWPQAHNDVVQELLRKGAGRRAHVLLPGNHDEFLRGFYGTHFGGIEVVESVVHSSLRGAALSRDPRRPVRRRHHPGPLARAARAGKAYDLAIALNTHFNARGGSSACRTGRSRNG
jgi:predicted MPP superfamily phosphohydrolase